MDITAGRGAVRGLGAPTQAGLAQTIAPTLAGMRQQRVENLMGARGQDIGVRGQDIMGLLELAGLTMPQVVGGQRGTGSQWQGGLCCFIFMESYGGLLDIVRKYRDEHMTDKNRRGYYRLADKIVPLMKKSQPFKWTVKLFMTTPMVSYGKYYYGKGKLGIIFKPIVKFWLKVFDWLGKGKFYVRSNGEVI